MSLSSLRSWNFFLRLCCLLMLWNVPVQQARAEGPDGDYVAIYLTIDQADAAKAEGRIATASTGYKEALAALKTFKEKYPKFSVGLIAYRLNYLQDKVEFTSAAVAAAASNHLNAATSPKPAPDSAEAPSPSTLLDPGAEPRIHIRLHPGVGDKQSIGMTFKMDLDVSTGGQSLPKTHLPAMTMNMDVAVKNIADNGDVTYEMTFGESEVQADPAALPVMVDTLKKSFERLRGLSGTGLVSAKGLNKGVQITLPQGVDPQIGQALGNMKQSFSSVSCPFPDEEVGVGARWQHVMKLKSQGITIEQVMEYELVSIENDRLSLKTKITQSAAGQKIQNPALPGMNVDLTRLEGEGTGTSVIDLGHILPSSGSLNLISAATMAMKIGDQNQEMEVKTAMVMDMQSK